MEVDAIVVDGVPFKTEVHEAHDGGYAACCPGIGCLTTAPTIEEALSRLRETVIAYCASLRERKDGI